MCKTGMICVSLGLLLRALRRLLAHQTMQAATVAETTLDPAGVAGTSADPPPEQRGLDAGRPAWQPRP